MASNAPITVQDGQSTPVNHTFSGIKISGDTALYDNRAETVASCRETLALRMNTGPKVRTVRVNEVIPRVVTETINGVDIKTVPDYATVKTEILIPVTWGEAEAKNARVMHSNLLKHAAVEAMSDTGEFVW